MPSNNIAFARNYTSVIDEVYQRASVSGVLNSGRRMVRAGHNAKEILIPKISVTGLGNYTRNVGYKTGAITYEFETKTFNYDRGIRLFADVMDVEEAGVNDCFVEAGAELQRTQVAPEADAFAFAEIAGHEGVSAATTDYSDAEAEDVLADLAHKVYAAQERQNDTAAEIAVYEKKLADNKKAISNVLRAIESGAATQTLPARLQELENEQAIIEGELTCLKGHKLEFSEDQILFALTKHLEPYPGETEQDYRRRIICDFVSEVYAYDDHLLIFFNISGVDGKLKSADLAQIEAGEFNERISRSTN